MTTKKILITKLFKSPSSSPPRSWRFENYHLYTWNYFNRHHHYHLHYHKNNKTNNTLHNYRHDHYSEIMILHHQVLSPGFIRQTHGDSSHQVPPTLMQGRDLQFNVKDQSVITDIIGITDIYVHNGIIFFIIYRGKKWNI